jgi:hypothetical protein
MPLHSLTFWHKANNQVYVLRRNTAHISSLFAWNDPLPERITTCVIVLGCCDRPCFVSTLLCSSETALHGQQCRRCGQCRFRMKHECVGSHVSQGTAHLTLGIALTTSLPLQIETFFKVIIGVFPVVDMLVVVVPIALLM